MRFEDRILAGWLGNGWYTADEVNAHIQANRAYLILYLDRLVDQGRLKRLTGKKGVFSTYRRINSIDINTVLQRRWTTNAFTTEISQ